MAETTPHTIRSQVFDVYASAQHSPMQVQDAFSRAQRNTLERVIAEVLDEFEEPGTHMRANTLYLDIGPVRLSHLDQDLAEKVRIHLRNAIQRLLDQGSVDKEAGTPMVKRETPADNALAMFRHFLLHGVLPWWSVAQPSLDTLFDSLLGSSPARVEKLIRDIGRKDFVRKRIVMQFDDQRIERLVTVLEPVEAGFIIEYADYLQQRHEKEPVARVDSSRFREAKWEFILAYILLERGSLFNRKEFVRSLIQKLAARYALDYITFLTYLETSAQEKAQVNIKASLYQLLKELYAEALAKTVVDQTQPETQTALPSGQEEGLNAREAGRFVTHYLRHGSIPWWSALATRKEAETFIGQWWREQPGQARALYYQWVGELARQPASYIPLRFVWLQKLMAAVFPREWTRFGNLFDTLKQEASVLPQEIAVLSREENISVLLIASMVFEAGSPQDEDIRRALLKAWLSVKTSSPLLAAGTFHLSRETKTAIRESYYMTLGQPASAGFRQLVAEIASEAGVAAGNFEFSNQDTREALTARWKSALVKHSGQSRNLLLTALKDELFGIAYEFKRPYFELLLAFQKEAEKRGDLDHRDRQLIAELLRDAIRVRTQMLTHGKATGSQKTEEAQTKNNIPESTKELSEDSFERHFEIIVYYIRHQRMPWWVNDVSADRLLLLLKELQSRYPSQFSAAVRHLVRTADLKRGLLDPKVPETFFIALLSPGGHDERRTVEMLFHLTGHVYKKAGLDKKISEQAWLKKRRELALESLLFFEAGTSAEEFVNLWLEWLWFETGADPIEAIAGAVTYGHSTEHLLPRQETQLRSWIKMLTGLGGSQARWEAVFQLAGKTQEQNIPVRTWVKMFAGIKPTSAEWEAMTNHALTAKEQKEVDDILHRWEEVLGQGMGGQTQDRSFQAWTKMLSAFGFTPSVWQNITRDVITAKEQEGTAGILHRWKVAFQTATGDQEHNAQFHTWIKMISSLGLTPSRWEALLSHVHGGKSLGAANVFSRWEEAFTEVFGQKAPEVPLQAWMKLLSGQSLDPSEWTLIRARPEAGREEDVSKGRAQSIDPGSDVAKTKSGRAKATSLANHPQRLRIFTLYLLSGSVPGVYGNYTRAEGQTFLAEMIGKHRKNVLSLLRNPLLRSRLLQTVQDLPAKQKHAVLKDLLEGPSANDQGRHITGLRNLLMRLAHLHLSSDRKQTFEQFLNAQLLTLLAFGPNGSAQDIGFRWMKIALAELGRHVAKPLPGLLEDLDTLMITFPVRERLLVQPHLDHFTRSSGIRPKDTDEILDKEGFPEGRTPKEEEEEDAESEELNDDPSLQVFVENAGLVLLWPFLSTYFQRLDLMFAGKFRDDKSAYRATHLLHYLATGQERPQEYLLVLNKVLCGVKTAKPVSRDIQLTDEEKQLSEGLLKAVTQQWEPLKNTSVNGLREAFLQRQGRLITNEENHVLRVEQKSYDMLLDKLPWTIGMIKTSWMDKLIQVEWR